MKTVLISEPNASNSISYLPYVWGVLKTAADKVAELKDNIVWLDPISFRDSAEAMLSPYDVAGIDVLGLSCYTWNFDLQCEIAAIVKRSNPACITVAGGPHPQIKDPDFFRNHPYFDVIAVKDGEETFSALLLAVLNGEADFRGIGGLYLAEGPSRDMHFTGPAKNATDFSVSPYIAQTAFYSRLMTENPLRRFGVIWETTRGCPYSCSFCDWGSSTMSKIRQFDLGRVMDEVEWITARDFYLVIQTDANFGILPRDPEIAQHFAKLSRQYGKVKTLHFSSAKNNPDRAMAIQKIFFESNVIFQPTLSIQHTDSGVLDSVDRRNISAAKQYEVAKELRSIGADVDAQLIMGMPGDNFERWRECLNQLMRWGMHNDYSIFYFNLLPNAPAADAAYRSAWQIETIKRVVRDPSARTGFHDDDGIAQEFIIGSRNFSPADWVDINVYTTTFRALHTSGLTQLVAIALHESCGIEIGDFYRAVVGDFFRRQYRGGALYGFAKDHFDAVLTDETMVADQTNVPELCDDSLHVAVCQALLMRVAMDADNFYDELGRYLRERFAAVDPVLFASLLDYQRNMIVLPHYNPADGKRFAINHDWPSYFSATKNGEMSGDRPAAAMVANSDVATHEHVWPWVFSQREAVWTGSSGAQRWHRWATFAMNSGAKVANILHQDIHVVPAAKPSATRAAGLANRLWGLLRVPA